MNYVGKVTSTFTVVVTSLKTAIIVLWKKICYEIQFKYMMLIQGRTIKNKRSYNDPSYLVKMIHI